MLKINSGIKISPFYKYNSDRSIHIVLKVISLQISKTKIENTYYMKK